MSNETCQKTGICTHTSTLNQLQKSPDREEADWFVHIEKRGEKRL